jgi:hypothetical protein
VIVYLQIVDKGDADALEKAAHNAGLIFVERGELHARRVLALCRIPTWLRSSDDKFLGVSGTTAAGTEAGDSCSGANLGFDTCREGE